MVGMAKRARRHSNGSSSSNDDAFDDGDDLMARAADIADDFGEEGSSDSEDGEADDDDVADGILDDDDDSQASSSRHGGREHTSGAGKTKDKGKGKQKALDPDIEDYDGMAVDGDNVDGEGSLKSALHMQLDALLGSVRCPSPTSSKGRRLLSTVQRIREIVLATPAVASQSASAAAKSLSTPLPFSRPDEDLQSVNWQLAYLPPKQVVVGGSWPLGTACKWKGKVGWSMDLLLEMPEVLFQEKDVKDHRYFYKRAFFLAKIYEALSSSDLPLRVTYSHLSGNERKPIIELAPNEAGGDLDIASLRCSIRIIPMFSAATFPASMARLHPARNNLRARDNVDAEDWPTPIYNGDIAADATPLPTSQYLQSITDTHAEYRNASLLLKVWAKQRKYHTIVGLSHVHLLLSLILAYLVSGDCTGLPRAPLDSSAWQLFKRTLGVISDLGVRKRAMVSKHSLRNAKAATSSEWGSLPSTVLTDVTGVTNLLGETPAASLRLLSHDAQMSLIRMRQDEVSAVVPTFLTLVNRPHVAFDSTLRVDVPAKLIRARGAVPWTDASSQAAALVIRVADVLQQALSDRAKSIAVSMQPIAGAVDAALSIQIGLHLNAAQLSRVVEYGPPADDASKAQKFRAFWGSKAETRRFKDGRILESIVWDAEGPSERGKIFVQIIRHVLQHHFGINPESAHALAGLYDHLLLEAEVARSALYTNDPRLTGFAPVTAAFDSMSKELRALKDLPLGITNVAPIAEELRYSSVFVPGPFDLKKLSHAPSSASYVPAQECSITFAGSGKWPDDLEALQKVKAAFLARIGNLYRTAVPGSRCDITLDLEADPKSSNVSLDITVPEGYVFRLHIHQPREKQLLEETLLDDEFGTDPSQSERLLRSYHRRFVARPAHHAAIAALQHRHTSLSATIRTTKRWLASHMLLPFVPTELIELLGAKVYLDSESPYTPPVGPTAGFARVLDLLSRWNWRKEPLLVPAYSSPTFDVLQGHIPTFSAEQAQAATSAFQTHRKADPGISKLPWFIATEQDLNGQAWAPESRLTKVIAARIQELAKVCLSALEHQTKVGDPNIAHLFTPDLAAFDFVLHLDSARVPRHRQAIHPNAKPLSKRSSTGHQPPRPGFDPVELFIKRAERAVGDTILLFYDPFGGLAICGLFNPSVSDKVREFRVTLDYPSKPAATAGNGDKDEIMEGADEQYQRQKKAQVVLDREVAVRRLVEMSEGLVTGSTTNW